MNVAATGRVADAIHLGVKCTDFHSCGNVTVMIPDLVAAGIDALNPLEVISGMDLKRVKVQFGDRTVVIGIANANIGQMGTPQDVRRDIRRYLADAARGGRGIVAGGKTPAAPVENLAAYHDEARTSQGYRCT